MPPIRHSRTKVVPASNPLCDAKKPKRVKAQLLDTSEETTLATSRTTVPKVTKAKGTGKGKGKEKGNVVDAYAWHPTVDYSPLLEQERQSRMILNLFTIFSLGSRNGLTVHNVRQMANELDMQDLALASPITVRNAIQRWNSTICAATNSGRMCDQVSCKQPALWGHLMEDPLTCERHKLEGMMLLVPGRLVQMESGLNGKYFMTDPLFSRLFHPQAPASYANITADWSRLFPEESASDELNRILAEMVQDC